MAIRLSVQSSSAESDVMIGSSTLVVMCVRRDGRERYGKQGSEGRVELMRRERSKRGELLKEVGESLKTKETGCLRGKVNRRYLKP